LNDEISPKLSLLICFDTIKISCKNVVCDDLEKNISLLKMDKIICKYHRLNITKKENCLMMMKKENIDKLIYYMESEKEGGMIYEMSLILLMKIIVGSLKEEKNLFNCMMICGELININGLDRLRMIFEKSTNNYNKLFISITIFSIFSFILLYYHSFLNIITFISFFFIKINSFWIAMMLMKK
jgi:hypothetical protein